jgi:hypothetical protein
LIDDGDTSSSRGSGRVERKWLAVEEYFAGVGRVGSAKNLDERAFSSSIFPEQSEDFAPSQLQVNVPQCSHPGVGFADPPHLEQ